MISEVAPKYFKEVTVTDYFNAIEEKFPFLFDILDKDRFSTERIEQLFSKMKIIDFEGDSKGGRGKAYFLAQNKYPLNRSVGFRSILDRVGEKNGSEKKLVLDLLGGNGTLYRAVDLLGYDHLQIIINDISEDMIQDAFRQNIPCIRQPAQNLLLQDNCLDAVIFAYGTHHIPMKDRSTAFEEANRVLKPGGKMVFHDYEEGSLSSKWYSEVLHKYTYTGHDFTHFDKDQLKADLEAAGFEDVNVFYNYDPFILRGATAKEAKENLLDHLISLFGLMKFSEKYEGNRELFFQKAEEMVNAYSDFTNYENEEANRILKLKTLSVYPDGEEFCAEMPRFSLMATGVSTAG